MKRTRLVPALLTLLSSSAYARGAEPVVIDRPMAPPAWALLESALLDQQSRACDGPLLTVQLDPGCGAKLDFRMRRYRNRPSLALPWDKRSGAS